MKFVTSIMTATSLLVLLIGTATAQTDTAMPADPDDPKFQEWCLAHWDDCKVAVKIGIQQIPNLSKISFAECVRIGLCHLSQDVDIWNPPVPFEAMMPMRAASTMGLTIIDDPVTVPSQVIGIPDICTKAIWVDGSVPPECLGPIKNILIQSGRVLK